MTYKSVTVPVQMNFDCEADIIGIPELTKYIDTLDTSRLRELNYIMEEELKPRAGARPARINLLVESGLP